MEEFHPFAPQKKSHRALWIGLISGFILLIGASIAAFLFLRPAATVTTQVTREPESIALHSPEFDTQAVLSNLDRPWDIAFLPDGSPIFTERGGTLNIIKGTSRSVFARISDVSSEGEGGLTGLAVDPDFAKNRYIYTCYNTASDIQVVRWKTNDDISAISDKQPIVTNIPSSPGGRHSGCRMAFGPDGFLWIGTGDAAKASHPQDPRSLGGKILRVSRDGKGAADNLPAPFDDRVYSYGHRNTQGIAFIANPSGDRIGYSAEHGSSVDDEVNELRKGNFGWDPDAAYTEANIPMTDKKKFPDAIDAIWNSGDPTQAPSGLIQIHGEEWSAWNGMLAMAMLKAQHLKILTLDSSGKVIKEEKVLTDRGRLRDVQQAPDGSLYVTTDNGEGKDQIIRLTPKE